MSIEFEPWPKIARLNRDCTITEKIDGTNAAVGIKLISQMEDDDASGAYEDPYVKIVTITDEEHGTTIGDRFYPNTEDYAVYAQSRKRLINPDHDNAGFARYVDENASQLVSTLGVGLHFGEWWGSGIQRGYGLTNGEKRFSLFNTPRYSKFDLSGVPKLGTVPVLYEGPFSSHAVDHTLAKLEYAGSSAAPGFKDPEGIIVFHVAAQLPFKVTIKGDEKPKESTE